MPQSSGGWSNAQGTTACVLGLVWRPGQGIPGTGALRHMSGVHTPYGISQPRKARVGSQVPLGSSPTGLDLMGASGAGPHPMLLARCEGQCPPEVLAQCGCRHRGELSPLSVVTIITNLALAVCCVRAPIGRHRRMPREMRSPGSALGGLSGHPRLPAGSHQLARATK